MNRRTIWTWRRSNGWNSFWRNTAGTVLVISHDRYFLDRVITKVVEIEDGEAFIYHTNYSGYQKEKEERLLLQFAQYQEQQKKIKKCRKASSS